MQETVGSAAAHRAGRAAMQKADPRSAAPLPARTPIDATHSVPYGGGVASDGKTIYIDKRIPQTVQVEGKTVDAHDVIAHAHEAPEFPQMKSRGKDYDAAHHGNANVYEATYLRKRYGVSHGGFDKALKPHLKNALDQGSGAKDIPTDLDRKPYVDSNEEHLLGNVQYATIKDDDGAMYLTTRALPGSSSGVGGDGRFDLFTAAGNPASTVGLAASSLLDHSAWVKTGMFHSTVKVIKSWMDAASIVAPLGRSKQEQLSAVVADMAGKPLAVIRQTIVPGSKADAASVFGAATKVRRGSKVWFAHNHSAGAEDQSDALTSALQKLARDAGLDVRGLIDIDGDQATFFVLKSGH